MSTVFTVLETLMVKLNNEGFNFKMYEWRGENYLSDGYIPAISYNRELDKKFLVTNHTSDEVKQFRKNDIKDLISFIKEEHNNK